MAVFLLITVVCFLAYSNGANDNFKGVASLYGSGAASYRTALAWATIATLAGSLCALLLAQTPAVGCDLCGAGREHPMLLADTQNVHNR